MTHSFYVFFKTCFCFCFLLFYIYYFTFLHSYIIYLFTDLLINLFKFDIINHEFCCIYLSHTMTIETRDDRAVISAMAFLNCFIFPFFTISKRLAHNVYDILAVCVYVIAVVLTAAVTQPPPPRSSCRTVTCCNS